MPIAGGLPISLAGQQGYPTVAGTSPQAPAAPAAPAATTAIDPVLLYTQYPIQNEWEWNSAGTSLPRNIPLTGQNSGWPTWQYNDGYDANATRPRGKSRAAAVNKANAIITDGLSTTDSHQMSVFVTDIEIDIAIAGTTAQSQMTRDFYPRNFIQPSFVVSGVSMDQDDYALLCEFIHSAQQKAVKGTYKDLTQLYVMGRDPDPKKSRGWDGSYTAGRRVMISQPGNLMKGRLRDPDNSKVAKGTYVNQHTRGSHQPIVAKGYIATMPRIHQQFTYAMTWQFDFVVAAMLSGIYSERTPMAPTVQKTWANMLADAQAQGVVSFSNAENKSLLSYAANHDSIDGTLITGSNSGSTSTPTSGGNATPSGSVNTSGLTVKGAPMSASQATFAAQIINIGKGLGASPTAIQSVILEAIAESVMGDACSWNPTYGGLLAGNVKYFGGLGADNSVAVAAAEIKAAFSGPGSTTGFVGAMSIPGNDLLQIAMTNSGSGTQYEGETGYTTWAGESVAIYNAYVG